MIWLHNKFPTLKDTLQTVLIESSQHDGDISNYSQQHNRELMAFAMACFRKMLADPQFKSVVCYKNFGPNSGGSLSHPHMQIVGFEKEDAYKYIHPNNFEGYTAFEDDNVEVNVADHPVQGYIEFNANLRQDAGLNLWADWIQVIAKFILTQMFNGRVDSYNLFFYPRQDGGICAKLVNRFSAPPYFVGYKLSQVDDPNTLVNEVKRLQAYWKQKHQQ